MKKSFALILLAVLLAGSLAACANADSSSTPPAILPAPVSGSESAAGSASTVTPAGQYDVAVLLASLSEAAHLGTSIPMSDLDLKAGGIDVDSIVEWAGATSQRAAENGGQVIVFYAAPGKADALADQLAAFRDSHINDQYAENETANANTQDARIVVNGDYVVYAVSATGHEGGYDTLDTAISAAFA